MDETKKLGPKEFNLNKKLLKSLHVIDDDQKSIQNYKEFVMQRDWPLFNLINFIHIFYFT